jgi:hypothetical protein
LFGQIFGLYIVLQQSIQEYHLQREHDHPYFLIPQIKQGIIVVLQTKLCLFGHLDLCGSKTFEHKVHII